MNKVNIKLKMLIQYILFTATMVTGIYFSTHNIVMSIVTVLSLQIGAFIACLYYFNTYYKNRHGKKTIKKN